MILAPIPDNGLLGPDRLCAIYAWKGNFPPKVVPNSGTLLYVLKDGGKQGLMLEVRSGNPLSADAVRDNFVRYRNPQLNDANTVAHILNITSREQESF